MLFIFLMAVSLSLDALAVSVTSGLTVKNFGIKHALLLGMYFGGFQFLMPLAGWFLGCTVKAYVAAVSPYLSFLLLASIGGKMIWEACFPPPGAPSEAGRLRHGRLLVLAVATSLDAFAAGITFAFTGIPVRTACTVTGLTAFVLSALGGLAGGRLGSRFQKQAAFLGGAVLVLLGIKALVQGIC